MIEKTNYLLASPLNHEPHTQKMKTNSVNLSIGLAQNDNTPIKDKDINELLGIDDDLCDESLEELQPLHRNLVSEDAEKDVGTKYITHITNERYNLVSNDQSVLDLSYKKIGSEQVFRPRLESAPGWQ